MNILNIKYKVLHNRDILYSLNLTYTVVGWKELSTFFSLCYRTGS